MYFLLSQSECSNSVQRLTVLAKKRAGGRGGRHSCGSSIQYQQLGSARSPEGWQHSLKWIDTVLITFISDTGNRFVLVVIGVGCYCLYFSSLDCSISQTHVSATIKLRYYKGSKPRGESS